MFSSHGRQDRYAGRKRKINEDEQSLDSGCGDALCLLQPEKVGAADVRGWDLRGSATGQHGADDRKVIEVSIADVFCESMCKNADMYTTEPTNSFGA